LDLLNEQPQQLLTVTLSVASCLLPLWHSKNRQLTNNYKKVKMLPVSVSQSKSLFLIRCFLTLLQVPI
jgi:hypothetical protein